MNLTTRRKRPAPTNSTRYRSRYLDELIDFGGEPLTRAEVVTTMRQQGTPQPLIDRWLQGQELAARLRTRHARLTTTILLPHQTHAVPSSKANPKAQTPPQR